MKRINGGEELAKEIGCDAEVLKKTCKLDAPRSWSQLIVQSTTTTTMPRTQALTPSRRRYVEPSNSAITN
jgi:hypothetical protein